MNSRSTSEKTKISTAPGSIVRRSRIHVQRIFKFEHQEILPKNVNPTKWDRSDIHRTGGYAVDIFDNTRKVSSCVNITMALRRYYYLDILTEILLGAVE